MADPIAYHKVSRSSRFHLSSDRQIPNTIINFDQPPIASESSFAIAQFDNCKSLQTNSDPIPLDSNKIA